jgi:hypothetical protein
MAKLALTFGFLFAIFTSFAQSYLGWATKQVNFRSGPGTEYEVISAIPAGSQIFIVSTETVNDFYNIIDIATDKEGYIHKSFVKLGDKVEVNNEGVFTLTGKSNSANATLKIYNNTNISMTLMLNGEKFPFKPQEKRSIEYRPGTWFYRASAPGVIPNIGTEEIQSNAVYDWEFYIVSGHR